MSAKWVGLGVLTLLVAPLGSLRADDAAAQAREVELYFLQGALDDLPTTDDPVATFARQVRDGYWRAVPGVARMPRAKLGHDPRLRDLPVLSALIRDRMAREDVGVFEPSPLLDLHLTGQEGEALDVGLNLLTVLETFQPNEHDLKSVARAEALATRNAWIGWLAVLGLLGVALGLARRTRRPPG